MVTDTRTTRVYTASNGQLDVYFVAPAVMVFKWKGAHSGDSAKFLRNTINSVTALGIRPNFYVDLEEMTTVDNAYKAGVVEAVVKTRKEVGVYNFFVKSKLLGMIVSVVNLAAGGVLVNQVFSNREAFEAAIRKEAGNIIPIAWPAGNVEAGHFDLASQGSKPSPTKSPM